MGAPTELHEKKNIITGEFNGSMAVPQFCLVYQETDDFRPAAAHAEVTNEAGTQAAFGPKFVGVSMDAKLATDGAGKLRVARTFVGEFDCVSGTYEVGDKVCPAYNTDKLHNLTLKKTTVNAAAIGRVLRRGTTVTRLLVELQSRVLPPVATAEYIP